MSEANVNITKSMIGMGDVEANQASLVGLLKTLRSEMERARARFMLTLLYVEQNFAERLAEWGHPSFDAFIDAHELCRPAKYRDFVAGLESVGDPQIAELLGVEATQIASTLRTPATRDEYVTSLVQWQRENGVCPSRQVAQRQANALDGKRYEPRTLTRAQEVERLRVENQQLRAQLRKSERRVAKLEAALSKRKAAA